MEEKYHYISKGVADMHVQANPMSEVVSQGIYATTIKIIGKEDSWVHIETPDVCQGWIKAEELISRDTVYPSTPHIAQVDTLWTHLCWVDDTTPHPPALTIPFESKVEIISEKKDLHQRWMQVRLVDGTIVWAQSRDFRIDPKLISLEDVIKLSKRFLGLPYRWGGTSGFGFDCSGFVQTLYRQIGIELPRCSADQANVSFSRPVCEKELQPGDLLFFCRGGPEITHVGMHLESDQFIHAVTTNTYNHRVIQISELSDPEWYSQYHTARRYQFSH